MKKLFRKIFGSKKQREVKTMPLSEEELLEAVKPVKGAGAIQLLTGYSRSVGKQRNHNEDSLFALSSYLTDLTKEIPFGIYIIADGMGGHLFGDVASNTAAKTFSKHLLEKLYLPSLDLEIRFPSESLQEMMEESIGAAQAAVQKAAPGGGTTLTAALILGEQITIAHVGDSRAYFLFPDGRTQRITYDHTLVHRLVELGQLEEKEVNSHPQRNVLYRAIGQAEPYKPDIATFPLPKPGKILICSDGLWSTVSEDEIFKIVNSTTNPASACNHLVDAANTAGGPDNISVILIEVKN